VRAALGGIAVVKKADYDEDIGLALLAYAMMHEQLGSGLGRAVVNSGKIVF
jgi:hypothetical protein